ncbi:MAG: hypothetical protein RLZZ387_1515 [Chloroflexota bacterium]|jgi:hypothetical protein
METAFESLYTDFKGKVTKVMVMGSDPATNIDPPPNIVRADRAAKIQVEWEVTGLAVATQAGHWRVTAYLESIGPGGDQDLPNLPGFDEKVVALNYGQTNYSTAIDINPGDVPVNPGPRARAYHLVVGITYTLPGAGGVPSNVPGPMAAFAESGIVQFYQA